VSTLIDATGHAVSGATPEGLSLFEQASRELLCLVDDPLATVQRALQAAPEMTMAHVLVAWLHLLGTEPSGNAVAAAACEAARALPADARERAHIDAAAALADGRWREAALRMEDLSLRWPRDTLALQVGHQIDFFRGDSRMLRDRLLRALPAWDAGVPGWHGVLGMLAFGLCETGDLAGAERQGCASVELEPRDSWGWHAVSHALEMRRAPREGVAWLAPQRATWSNGSFLAIHNTWHLALFELELDHIDEALRLYDEAIGGSQSSIVLDLIDTSALLARLAQRGVDVGNRWQPVAQRWAAVFDADGPMQGAGRYAFNDLHAMLAFVGADRAADQTRLLDAMQAAAERGDDNAGFTRDVGLPAARAAMALGRGDGAAAAALLRPVRHQAHRFGGSHAQRDLIDLMLIDAAVKGHDAALAAGLAAERLHQRPASPFAQRLAHRWRVGASAAD